MYGCDDATSVQLVNDYYFLDSGVMCPHGTSYFFLATFVHRSFECQIICPNEEVIEK